MKFYLPNLDNYNVFFINYLNQNKDMFEDDVEIGGVYGCFKGMKWNGGRTVALEQETFDNIIATFNQYNSINIPIRFTLTNTKLTKEDILYDDYCNGILREANDRKINEVIVNDAFLENYIRTNFKNLKIISSTTKCIRDVDIINEQTSKYHLVVIDYRDNNNTSFLNALNNKDKIEILLNAYCSPTCQCRLEHYDYLSMEQIGIHTGDFDCPCMENSFFDSLEYESVIKKDELYKKLKDMGFSNFKIEGRSNHIVDVIDSYVYYMVKDEYKDRVRNILLKNVFVINPNFVSNILNSIFNI